MSDKIILCIMAAVFCLAIGSTVGRSIQRTWCQEEAIEAGVGYYHHTTGDFVFGVAE